MTIPEQVIQHYMTDSVDIASILPIQQNLLNRITKIIEFPHITHGISIMTMTYGISKYTCNKYGIFYNGTLIVYKYCNFLCISSLIDTNELHYKFEQYDPHCDFLRFQDNDDIFSLILSGVTMYNDCINNCEYIYPFVYKIINNGNFKFKEKDKQFISKNNYDEINNVILKKSMRKERNAPEDIPVLNGLWYE